MSSICKYYPSKEEETSVCHCGSIVSSLRICTEKDFLSCPWAREKEKEERKFTKACEALKEGTYY